MYYTYTWEVMPKSQSHGHITTMEDVAAEPNNTGESRWSLKGMGALVAGGNRGSGYVIVEELCSKGARVHICCRGQEDIDRRIQEWKTKEFQVSGSVCDLTSNSDRRKLVDAVSSVFHGWLNILVNNAGITSYNKFLNWSPEDYSNMMTTNLEAPFHMCQLAHPLLKASGNGSVVFVSSVAGLHAFPYLAGYSAAKAGINQLTRNLAFLCMSAASYISGQVIAVDVALLLLLLNAFYLRSMPYV